MKCSDEFVSGSYNISGAGETDDDTFDNEDRPSDRHNNQQTYVEPSDPNVNSSVGDSGSDGGDVDETNGAVTDETDREGG